MNTIKAKVSSNLFQNPRRADATRVQITNKYNAVYVYDNGKGIDDFSKLLDMTGAQTDFRFMLPARTCIVENKSADDLKRTLEIEVFRNIQKRGYHSLPYKEYVRARKLNIDLPEAEPCFGVGLFGGHLPEPVGINTPK